MNLVKPRVFTLRTICPTALLLLVCALLSPHAALAQTLGKEDPPITEKPLWVADGDDINNANLGNVGIGTSKPAAKLDVAGVTKSEAFSVGGNSAEKTFTVGWSNNVANQKVQLYWPTNTQVDGIFEITVTGNYNYSNSNGGIRKRIGINGRYDGILNMQDSEVSFRLGYTANSYTISDIKWDATNRRYYFVIANLDNAQNGMTVHIKSITPGTGAINTASADKLNITPIYTDATIFPKLYTSFNSNVGIGTSAPASSLDVRKDLSGDIGPVLTLSNAAGSTGAGAAIDFSNPSLTFPQQARIQAADNNDYSANLLFLTRVPDPTANALAERMRITSSGNVGINNNAPVEKLDVVGNVKLSGAVKWGGGASSLHADQGGSIELGSSQTAGAVPYLDFHYGVGSSQDFNVRLHNSGNNLFTISNQAALNVFAVNGDNVGVGITNPSFKLDVQGGKINASGGFCIAGDCKASWSQVGSQWSSSGTSLTYNSGNVGIGTTEPPSATLDVRNGSTVVAKFYGTTRNNQWTEFGNDAAHLNIGVGSATSTNGVPYLWSSDGRFMIGADGNPSLFISAMSGGNVGIGTAAPNAGRLVVQTGAGQFDKSIYVTPSTHNLSRRASITIDNWEFGQDSGGNGIKDLYFYGNNDIRFHITQNGNVGIGTTNATEKLVVGGNISAIGDISATGAINAKYQDVAEWVPSRQQLSAGTVVVLDPERANHIIASSKSYDTRVAGVVSAQPGITLGEAGAGKLLIATTGRVRVKVDATRVPVRIGDLLVTSDTKGVAMKSQTVSIGGIEFHRPGTLIGKALEPLNTGTGEILVLLSLQ